MCDCEFIILIFKLTKKIVLTWEDKKKVKKRLKKSLSQWVAEYNLKVSNVNY